MFEITIPSFKLQSNNLKAVSDSENFKLKLQNKKLYTLPLGSDCLLGLAQALSAQKEKILLVVPTLRQVMGLWKKATGEPVFPGELLFNEEKFGAALKKEILTFEEVKFLLKILIWKYTNWQTKTILDLNLSFFGGQFKELISGGEFKAHKVPQMLCVDQKTFLELSQKQSYKDRVLCVFGLSEFEQASSLNIGIRVGWGQVLYALKNIYNPELSLGEVSKKEKVLELLAAADLFFGLASALLKTGEDGFFYYKIDEAAEVSENYNKVKKAAANFADKLSQAHGELKSETLKRYAENLRDFFEAQTNRIKWVELASNRCVFYSSPIDISEIVKEILSPYKKVAFFDALDAPLLAGYFLTRLGLEDFKQETILESKRSKNKKAGPQGDLFSSVHASPGAKRSCVCRLVAQSLPEEELLGILREEDLPAVVLFQSALNAKQFYNQHYPELKKSASVFLQSSSGGSNKILRNFEINGNGLLLATDRFILKFMSNQGILDTAQHLTIKTLVINRLPFENYTHPYQEAVSKQFEDPFLEYSLPKALYNFHLILKFFNTEKLRNLYIYDPKLEKGYAKVFKDYLGKIENFKII